MLLIQQDYFSLLHAGQHLACGLCRPTGCVLACVVQQAVWLTKQGLGACVVVQLHVMGHGGDTQLQSIVHVRPL
jgi:hypothetical protein